jgi:Putative Actinobacterial Holin-X, holin superfamily III
MSFAQTPKSLIESVRAIVERLSRLAKLELELRTVGLKGKAIRLSLGAGLGLLAVLLAPLLVVFLLAALAAALATTMAVWLAILIVAGVLLVLVGGLAGAAAVLTSAALKGGGDGKA